MSCSAVEWPTTPPDFFGFEMWKQAAATGTDLLWHVRKNNLLPCEKRLPDGSYLSRIYPSPQVQRRERNGVVVRVIEYRLTTTIPDHERAPATEPAAIFHDCWKIETAFDELKSHLRGAHILLRSKTLELVRQGLMHEAALVSGEDPDRISFLHAVHVVRRKIATFGAIPPSGPEEIS